MKSKFYQMWKICSYRKLKNLEQEDPKTMTTMLREFIKIEKKKCSITKEKKYYWIYDL